MGDVPLHDSIELLRKLGRELLADRVKDEVGLDVVIEKLEKDLE